MRIPITKLGLPQVLVYPGLMVAGMIGALAASSCLPQWLVYFLIALFLMVFVWMLSFFRDPARKTPDEPDTLFSPADGKITDITEEDNEYIGGKSLKIGIFLSVFNVHINRAPCKMRVEEIIYKEGYFKNALDPESAKVNEANEVRGVRVGEGKDKIIVRQISGAIARRIVSKADKGQELQAGEVFGMIKFGSRTELYLPKSEKTECMVEIGQKVKAGLTPLVKYK